MANITNISNSTDCVDFSPTQYTVLVSIRATVAGISFFSCLAVILLIVVFKKYLFFTQRMILYLDIAALLVSLARTLNISVHLHNEDITVVDWYCTLTGFMDQYCSSCVVIAITCFTMDIFIQVACRCNTQRIEVLYVLLIFLFPALYCWIPFINHAYGEAGAWCWIKHLNEDCSVFKFGEILRFSLLYIPYFIIIPMLFILLLVTLCIIHFRRHDYYAQIDLQATTRRSAMHKEVRSLLWYPVLILLINLLPVATRLYEVAKPDDQPFVLWIFNSFLTPLEGTVIAVVFTLDPETRRRLTYRQLKTAVTSFCGGSSGMNVFEYPAELQRSSDSYNISIKKGDEQTLITNYERSDDA